MKTVSNIEVFNSQVDTWLVVVLILMIVTAIIAGYFLIALRKGFLGIVSALILFATCAVLPAWLLLGTKYSIDDNDLVIRSGPRLWTIPIASISSIEPSRDARSSPALSLNRLKIYYGNGDVVLVSPEDSIGFIQALGR